MSGYIYLRILFHHNFLFLTIYAGTRGQTPVPMIWDRGLTPCPIFAVLFEKSLLALSKLSVMLCHNLYKLLV